MHRSPSVLLAVCLGVVLSIAGEAQARTLEPGSMIIGAALGPSFKLGSQLGMSSGYFMVNGTGEYVFTPQWSGIGTLSLGLAGTISTRVRAGGRYRIIGGELPFSPYVQLEASAGRMFDVLGANLNSLGVRAGGGADYFLSAAWLVGVQGGWELARTTGQRPAAYSTLDVLLTFSHVF